jgi:hypothetical protein
MTSHPTGLKTTPHLTPLVQPGSGSGVALVTRAFCSAIELRASHQDLVHALGADKGNLSQRRRLSFMLSMYGFRWRYTSNFIESTDYYAKSLSGKVLPAFDDIAEEAHRMEQETYDRLTRLSDFSRASDPQMMASVQTGPIHP